MQIGSLYSTALPRMALMELSRPVCWISSSPRLPVNDRPAQMPTPSSSLQMRISRGSLSLASGRSRPSLVVMSGTEMTNWMPLALISRDDAFHRTIRRPFWRPCPHLHSLTFCNPRQFLSDASRAKRDARGLAERRAPHAWAPRIDAGLTSDARLLFWRRTPMAGINTFARTARRFGFAAVVLAAAASSAAARRQGRQSHHHAAQHRDAE